MSGMNRDEEIQKQDQTETIPKNEHDESEKNEQGEENIVSLPMHKFKERLERAKRRVVKSYGGFSPEEVQQLQGKVQDLEHEQNSWQERELEYLARADELEKSLADSESMRRQEVIRNALTRLFLDAGGLPSALQDALHALTHSDHDFVLGSDGKLHALTSENETVSTQEFINGFLDSRPYFKRAAERKGSGISVNGTPATLGGITGIDSEKLGSREGRLATARKMIRE